MTEEQIQKACAEAMGWKPQIMLRCHKCDTCYEADQGKDYSAGVFCPACREAGYTMVGVCHPEPDPESKPPPYPTSADSALELVEALRKEGWSFWADNSMNGSFHVIFQTLERRQWTDFQHHATTLPLAICGAYLKCKSLWKENETSGLPLSTSNRE